MTGLAAGNLEKESTETYDNETCCTTVKTDQSNIQVLRNRRSQEQNNNKADINCTSTLLNGENLVATSNGISTTSKIKDDCTKKTRRLFSFDEAPSYLQFNPFIRHGYRGLLNTSHCIESIFWWTNETINIWSHLFGLLLFTGLAINDIVIINIEAPFGDKVIVSFILLCFQICMFLSALYHTFSCRSERDYNCFLNLDLFGIALALYAIYISGIYYAYWCDQAWGNFYMLSVTLIFIIAMILQIPSLEIDSNVKMIVFVLWALYGVIPTFHWHVLMGGFANPLVQVLLPRVLGMYVISGTAFLIYLTKIPERWFPGKVDYIGHSHQWWHFFVLLALYYWHNSGMIYVQYRMNHACLQTVNIL